MKASPDSQSKRVELIVPQRQPNLRIERNPPFPMFIVIERDILQIADQHLFDAGPDNLITKHRESRTKLAGYLPPG